MKTLNDFIKELQQLKPKFKKLPVVIISENGLKLEPKAKVLMHEKETPFDESKEIIITY